MFCGENIHWIVQSFLYSAFTLFVECLPSKEIAHDGDSYEEYSVKTSRRILYSWDHDGYYRRHTNNDPNSVVYVLITGLLIIIGLVVRCCIKYGCQNEENYSHAVVHPPPRRFATRPSNIRRGTLAPPRSSQSLIIPSSDTSRVAFIGIENPNFNATNSSRTEDFSTQISDLPPPYETVVMSDANNPSGASSTEFPKVHGTLPPRY